MLAWQFESKSHPVFFLAKSNKVMRKQSYSSKLSSSQQNAYRLAYRFVCRKMFSKICLILQGLVLIVAFVATTIEVNNSHSWI